MLILLSSLTKTYGEEMGDRAILRLLKAVPTVIYNYPFGILPKELDQQLIDAGNQLVGFSRSSVYLQLFKSLLAKGATRVLLDQKIHDMVVPDTQVGKLLNKFHLVDTYPNPQFDQSSTNPYQLGESLGSSLLPIIKQGKGYDYLITASDMIAQGCAARISSQGVKIPADIQIVGFDKVDALPYFQHPISTIEVPVDKMVNTSLSLLENMPDSGRKNLAKARFLDE